MAKEQKTTIRYSISFRQKVIKEIEEEGLPVSTVARRYGIKGGNTVQRWLKIYGKNHLLNKIIRIEMKDEKDRIKELESELKRLKIVLADATLANNAMETLIDIVNEHYHTDVKKNLGPRLSKDAMNKKGIR